MPISLSSDDVPTEVIVDPHSRMGLMLADTVSDGQGDTWDLLIQLEEFLMETEGLTLVQAIHAGVLCNRIKRTRRN